MDQSTSNHTSLIQSTQTIVKCNERNRRRKTSDEYKTATQSGNKVIDDFIKYTQTNYINKKGKMEFVPYDQFENVEFIAEGGFSKVYKATWINSPILYEN